MKRIAVLAATLVSFLLSCCDVAAPVKPVEPVIKINPYGRMPKDVDGHLTAQATKAIAAFRKACKPLGDEPMWSEIIAIEAELFEEGAQFRLDRGWKVTLHLALKLPEDLVKIPKFHSPGGSNSGQTLHYDLGGGKTPGFLATKRVSQFLCGELGETDRATFQGVREMAILDSITLTDSSTDVTTTRKPVKTQKPVQAQKSVKAQTQVTKGYKGQAQVTDGVICNEPVAMLQVRQQWDHARSLKLKDKQIAPFMKKVAESLSGCWFVDGSTVNLEVKDSSDRRFIILSGFEGEAEWYALPETTHVRCTRYDNC